MSKMSTKKKIRWTLAAATLGAVAAMSVADVPCYEAVAGPMGCTLYDVAEAELWIEEGQCIIGSIFDLQIWNKTPTNNIGHTNPPQVMERVCAYSIGEWDANLNCVATNPPTPPLHFHHLHMPTEPQPNCNLGSNNED